MTNYVVRFEILKEIEILEFHESNWNKIKEFQISPMK